MGGEPAGDLCFGCGSAIDTLPDNKTPADEKQLEKYNKRDVLTKAAKQETEDGITLLRVIVCASKVVLQIETAASQGINPARSSMMTSVSHKSAWTVGFVSQEYWEKTNPSFESCGIKPEYNINENDEFEPGLHATVASLQAEGIPFRPVVVTVKRKALLDEELLGMQHQIRVGHAQTVWRDTSSALLNNYMPSSMRGGVLEMPKWETYQARAQQVRDLVQKKRQEREAARRDAQKHILGEVPEPELRPVIQTQSAWNAAMPLSMMPSMPSAPESKPSVGSRQSRRKSEPTAPHSQSLVVPPCSAAASAANLQVPPSASGIARTPKGESGSRASIALAKPERGETCQASAPQAGQQQTPRGPPDGSRRRRRPSDGTPKPSQLDELSKGVAGRARKTQLDIEEVDQIQFKDLELSISSSGTLSEKHVRACLAGWKGLKTVNAVPPALPLNTSPRWWPNLHHAQPSLFCCRASNENIIVL